MSKTILITGGAGFIAHHVIDKILRETDWNIVTLDRLDFSGNLNRTAGSSVAVSCTRTETGQGRSS
jgi:dTDP-D-glucose 4,6-dehydratase